MLGRNGEQKLLFGAGRKKKTVGRQGGINTLRYGTTTTTFENPEPPGIGDFNRLTWEQPGTSGKTQRFRERCFQG
jgi:hypothetical protein